MNQLEKILRQITGRVPPWDEDDISAYLMSVDHNCATDARALDIKHTEDLPITEYFINSSHNTYLVGGQYAVTGGRLDIEAYTRALREGCRCVEVDAYDGPDGEPIVTHGNATLGGGSAHFKDVIDRIAEVVFETWDTPLVLNIENHFKTQGVRAADILKQAFGDRLVCHDDPVLGHRNWTQTSAPTLRQLRGRVLCRSKLKFTGTELQTPLELANLFFLVNSKWKGAEGSRAFVNPYWKSSSLSETKVAKVLKNDMGKHQGASSASSLLMSTQLVEFNQKYMSRTYPKPSAVASQNYNPVPMWLLGFQVVALNFQTSGPEMSANRAMFKRSAGCGYVLKPPLMRRGYLHRQVEEVKVVDKRALLKETKGFASFSLGMKGSVSGVGKKGLRGLDEGDFSLTAMKEEDMKEEDMSDADGYTSDEDEGLEGGSVQVESDDVQPSSVQEKVSLSSIEQPLDLQRQYTDSTVGSLVDAAGTQPDYVSAFGEVIKGSRDDGIADMDSSITLSSPLNPSSDQPANTPTPVDQSITQEDQSTSPTPPSETPPSPPFYNPSNPSLNRISRTDSHGSNCTGSPRGTRRRRIRSFDFASSSPALSNGLIKVDEKSSVVMTAIEIIVQSGVKRGNSSLSQEGSENSFRMVKMPSTPEPVLDKNKVYVELVVDGAKLDRAVRRTEASNADNPEFNQTVSAVFTDSESAILSFHVMDEKSDVILASRSFFAHCLSPGTFNFFLLEHGGGEVLYVLTCAFNPIYSIKATSLVAPYKSHFLLYESPEPPLMSPPSKTASLTLVVMGAKMDCDMDVFETRYRGLSAAVKKESPVHVQQHKKKRRMSDSSYVDPPVQVDRKEALGDAFFKMFDPYVEVSVTGMPTDIRRVRTPRLSQCPTKNQWMHSFVISFVWSEFAFLQISLRSKRGRRRGSISRRAGMGGSRDTGIALETLWADSILPGYRSVPLYSEDGSLKLFALLCHFSIQEAATQSFTPVVPSQ